MSSITCVQAQSFFSEDLDARLDPMSQHGLKAHLALCPDCAARMKVFAAVQQTARLTLAADIAVPAFLVPAVRPARRIADWRSVAAAAMVLVLCSLAAFQLGRDSRPADGLSAGGAPQVLAASLFPQRLKDHIDATQMLGRQVLTMPPEAGEEAEMLVERQLQLLDGAALEAQAKADPWCREKNAARAVQEYLREWRACSAALQLQLQQPGHMVGNLQQVVGRSTFWRAAHPVATMTAAVPSGMWFSSNEGRAALHAACADPSQGSTQGSMQPCGATQDVHCFLQAHAQLLQARLAEARAGFAQLREQRLQALEPPRSSRLEQLARYMEAECLRRSGEVAASANIMLDGEAFQLPADYKERFKNDPVLSPVMMFQLNQPRFVISTGNGTLVDISGIVSLRAQPATYRLRVQWIKPGECGDCDKGR